MAGFATKAIDIIKGTKAPTGMTVTRNGKKMTVSWKIADADYGDGQQAQYAYTGSGWLNFNETSAIGKATTSKSVNLPFTNFYPYTSKYCYRAMFHVRGNRKKYTTGSGKSKTEHNPGWSDWTRKDMNFSAPYAPAISAALDGTLTNKTTFSWSVTDDTTSARPFVDIEWQTILVKNCNYTDGSKAPWKAGSLGWATGTTGASGSREMTEDTSLLASASYTRWFRVRSRGCAGASAWVYASHVYARPNQAVVKSASAKATSSNGYQCSVAWEASSTASNPIDQTTVQYTIVTPVAGPACPSGASWNEANVSADTSNRDGATFSVDDRLGTDECLFIRVNTHHDKNVTFGNATLVAVGALADPSGLSVSTNDQTYRATITATNDSQVPGSFLAVYYRPESKPQDTFIVGIIPSGSDSVTVQCPNWSEETAIGFGVRAMVGTYTAKARTDGATAYSVTIKMQSANTIWGGGSVPQAPTNVTVSKADQPNMVHVAWDWTWQKASFAELSWSDNPLAWESTNEPQSYRINNLYSSHWNIDNLDAGKTWYVRVRLIAATDSGETPGPYSDIASIDLASAPNIPVMALSAGVITEDGQVTASWGYSSTDGTSQGYADLCEYTVDYELTEDTAIDTSKVYYVLNAEMSRYDVVANPVVADIGSYYERTENYGRIIAHTETAQHVTISAEDAGWTAGNQYGLCVRVVSRSGRQSDGWSAPVFVAVAEPLTATITQTSLVDATRYYEGGELTVSTVTGLAVVNESTLANGLQESGNAFVCENPNLELEVFPAADDTYTIGATNATAADEFIVAEGLTTDDLNDLYGIELIDSYGNVDVRWDIMPTAAIYKTLADLPLTITVTGSGTGGTTTVVIERAASYYLDRPDDTTFNGHEGETIALKSQTGEEQMTIALGDLLGPMDDSALYRIVATVQDGLGQSATATLDFTVRWAHQAIIPEATAEADEENSIMKITPVAPTGTEEGDTCDIYRLSADRPELIVQNGTFGETYVDPYPAIGTMGGHRVVFKTVNGDYITEENMMAWVDLGEDEGDTLDLDYGIIDFAGNQLFVQFNTDLGSSFAKDFTETKYLGGSVQGDWNKSVSRTSTVSASAVFSEGDTLAIIRMLAAYPGICHVRTPDGSSYAADVQVNDTMSYDNAGQVVDYSLSITRVDSEGFDGVPLSQWETEEE